MDASHLVGGLEGLSSFPVGVFVGVDVGFPVCMLVEGRVVPLVRSVEGVLVGALVGGTEGFFVGTCKGDLVGESVGNLAGLFVGALVGLRILSELLWGSWTDALSRSSLGYPSLKLPGSSIESLGP